MSIIKLIPGQRIHFTVSAVEQVEGNYGPQYKFDGATPDDASATLFLNVSTAERQLDRIGYSLTSVVGQTVEIARTEKNGTKYTDINRVSGAAAPRAATSAPAQQKQGFSSGPALPGEDADEPTKLDTVLSLHDVCVMHAATRTAQLLVSKGFSPTAADILAAAATQMIGAQRVGASA